MPNPPSSTHLPDQLGLYSLGLAILDPDQQHQVETHLASCADCRAELAALHQLRTQLDDIPPEAFLDGPPPDGELLLDRVLATARHGRGHTRSRWLPHAAAIAIVGVLAAAIATGASHGHLTPTTSPVAQPPPAATANHPSLVLTAANPATGVRISANVFAQPGWIQIDARFIGVPPGTACRLLAHTRTGTEQTVLAWIAPANQPPTGVELQGAVLIDPHDLTGVSVTTLDGTPLVAATV